MYTRRTGCGPVGLLLQALRDLFQKHGYSLRFDLGQGLAVDACAALVLAHRLPRALEDIRQIQLVVERVEPPARIPLRSLVELRLELGRPV